MKKFIIILAMLLVSISIATTEEIEIEGIDIETIVNENFNSNDKIKLILEDNNIVIATGLVREQVEHALSNPVDGWLILYFDDTSMTFWVDSMGLDPHLYEIIN